MSEICIVPKKCSDGSIMFSVSAVFGTYSNRQEFEPWSSGDYDTSCGRKSIMCRDSESVFPLLNRFLEICSREECLQETEEG